MAKTTDKTPSAAAAASASAPAPAGGEVATTSTASTELATADAYAAYAGAGFENQTSEDYSIPFLSVLQALSPQVTEDPDRFRQGMIVNTVTGELFDGKKGVAFIPATTQHLYVEWKPRKAGGGFVGIHQPGSEVVTKAMADSASRGLSYGKITLGPGEMDNELIETFYVYGVAIDQDGNSLEAVLAFSSTKIKVYKGWMTKAKTIQIALPDGRRIPAPLFAHRYRLTATSEKNTKGQFYNWVVNFDGETAVSCRLLPSDPLFQQAFNVKNMIDTGKARAAHESAGSGADDTETAGAGAPAGGSTKPVF